jgi:hypothetical protein
MSGEVVSSSDSRFRPGDKVIATGSIFRTELARSRETVKLGASQVVYDRKQAPSGYFRVVLKWTTVYSSQDQE